MQKLDIDEDIIKKILGKTPERTRSVLLEYAKKPAGVSNSHMADLTGIDRNDLPDQYLQRFVESGIVTECKVTEKIPIGRNRTPTDRNLNAGCLNQDIRTLSTLFKIFSRHDALHDLLRTEYYYAMIPVSMNAYSERAVLDTGVPMADVEIRAFKIRMKYYPMVLDHVLNPDPEKHKMIIKVAEDDTRNESRTLQHIFRTDWGDIERIMAVGRATDHPNQPEKVLRAKKIVDAVDTLMHELTDRSFTSPMSFPYLHYLGILCRMSDHAISYAPSLPMDPADAAELDAIFAECFFRGEGETVLNIAVRICDAYGIPIHLKPELRHLL